MSNLLHLKSGTDIRGVALSDAGKTVELTDEVLVKITASFLSHLSDKLQKPLEELHVNIGYDSRLSSERITKTVSEAMLSLGVQVYDCGLSSTPSMYMSILYFGCDAAVEITASHLPMEMNGLKFFTSEGGYSGEEITSILTDAATRPGTLPPSGKKPKTLDNMDVYCEKLCEMIREAVSADDYEHPLKYLRIVVDAGNGVGAFYADKVLSPLGANTAGSRFLEPDGRFPNHIPNPENETAMQSICEAVKESGADFGVIFDTDCDRAACVDQKGNEINRNRLVALASAIALKNSKGGIIVTDSVTSDGLREFIEVNLSGYQHRFKRGYKNVIDEARRLSAEDKFVPLAIETSGHAAFYDNYYLDDGAFLMTKIIIELALMRKSGKSLSDILLPLREPSEEKEVRFPIALTDFRAYGEKVICDFGALAEQTAGVTVCPVNYEGMRVNFDHTAGSGWALLRLSVHEPLLVLNVESAKQGGVKEILRFVRSFITQYDKLDCSRLPQD